MSQQEFPIPVYTARRASGPPALDGTVSDPEWQRADPIALVRTDNAQAPRYPTEARMLWDEENLYIAFVCEDPDIWGTITERDGAIFNEEVVEVFIDDDSDGVSYYEFEVSPLNTVLDLLLFNRNNRIKSTFGWDCEGWRTAVHVDGTLNQRDVQDRRWSVEMAIPWREMMQLPNLPPKTGDRLRINLYRIDRAKDGDEYSAWSPTGAINYHMPHRFGHLVLGG